MGSFLGPEYGHRFGPKSVKPDSRASNFWGHFWGQKMGPKLGPFFNAMARLENEPSRDNKKSPQGLRNLINSCTPRHDKIQILRNSQILTNGQDYGSQTRSDLPTNAPITNSRPLLKVHTDHIKTGSCFLLLLRCETNRQARYPSSLSHTAKGKCDSTLCRRPALHDQQNSNWIHTFRLYQIALRPMIWRTTNVQNRSRF